MFEPCDCASIEMPKCSAIDLIAYRRMQWNICDGEVFICVWSCLYVAFVQKTVRSLEVVYEH